MARHVWSVLCYKACEDRETNQVSLLDVIEKVVVEVDPEEIRKQEDEIGKTALLPVHAHLMSWWTRSDYSQPEEAQGRIRGLAPGGKEILRGGPMQIVLGPENTGRRTKMKFQGIPLKYGPGLYWFIVELQQDGGWVEQTRIPLELDIQPQGEPSMTSSVGSRSSNTP